MAIVKAMFLHSLGNLVILYYHTNSTPIDNTLVFQQDVNQSTKYILTTMHTAHT